MVSKTLLSELNTILQGNYGMNLPTTELAEIANALVGIFELLAKMDINKNVNENYEHTILS